MNFQFNWETFNSAMLANMAYDAVVKPAVQKISGGKLLKDEYETTLRDQFVSKEELRKAMLQLEAEDDE